MPTLGAGESFNSATLTIDLRAVRVGTIFNGDLVGLTRTNAAATVLGADWGSTGTLLQNNFLTPASAAETDLTSSDFTSWINTQYAGGTNAGKFVFIKVDAEGYTGNGFVGYQVYSGNNATKTKPTLTYTTIPEPSSLALVGLAGLALGLRRRRA